MQALNYDRNTASIL